MSGDEIKSLGELTPDPENARQHNPRNIGMIESALREVGAGRSILIDGENVIVAGNGVVEAAAAAGIERVRVIEADGQEIIAVRRRDLTPEQRRRMALYDNRTAELATWDVEVLRSMEEAMEGLWSDSEIARMFERDEQQRDAEAKVSEQLTFQVVVTCRDEGHQAELIQQLESQGLECKPLVV